jgi:hypothetical protein
MRNTLFVLAACAALLTGCGGGGGDSSDGGSTPPANNPRNISVNPTTVSFGTVAVGANADQTITVSNTGNATLTLGTIGTPNAPFTRNGGTCTNNQTLAAGASCTVIMRYTPAGTTTSNGGFNIASDDPEIGTGNGQNNVAVSLSGTGGLPNINVSSTTIGFGSVAVGQSADQTITVNNNGTVALTLGTIGTPTGPFARTGGTCTNSQQITAGNSCTVIVRFTPTGTGAANGNFNIPSNDPDAGTLNGQNNVAVSLSGTGTAAAIANINVNPTAVSFGTVAVGATADQTITVGNSGSATLTLGTITTPTGPFARNGGSCASNGQILAGNSCTIIVRFTPTGAGAASGGFSIPSNDPDTGTNNGQNDVAVSLSGTGATPNINVSSTSINFGSIAVGASADQTITVSNTGGATLTLGSIASPAAPFSRNGGSCTNSQQITAGNSCTVIVRFTPTGTGAVNGNFNIPSNDPDAGTLNGQNNVAVSLSGTGNAPDINVNPTTVSFGTVTVGATADQTVTVSNNGNVDLTLGTIGTPGAPFSRQGGTCLASGQVLAANASCTVTVRFAPTSAGAVNGNFSIPSNDPDTGTGNGQNNVAVSLSGTGGSVTPPPTTSYHYYTGTPTYAGTPPSPTSAIGGLYGVGSASPATPATVNANALANDGDIERITTVWAGTEDAAGNITNARHYAVVFAAGGRLWKQYADQAPAPVQVSSVTTIGTGPGNGGVNATATDLCDIKAADDFASPENSVVIYGLAGADRTCDGANDNYFWTRLSATGSTAPTALTVLPVAPVFGAGGAVTGFLAINTSGALVRLDANFGGTPTTIAAGPFAVNAGDKDIWLAHLAPNRALLHLPPPCTVLPCPISGELRIVDTNANTITAALATVGNRTAFRYDFANDDSYVYFFGYDAAGTPSSVIERFPVDGSATATTFHDAGTAAGDFDHLRLTPNSVVYRQSSTTSDRIVAVPKAGGAPVTLASSSVAGERLPLLWADSTGYVYYDRYTGASATNRAHVVMDNGSGLVTYGETNGGLWAGIHFATSFNGYTGRKPLAQAVVAEYGTTTTLSVINPATAAKNGTIVGQLPLNYIFGVGIGARALYTTYSSATVDTEVYYVDATSANSLVQVTNNTTNEQIVD